MARLTVAFFAASALFLAPLNAQEWASPELEARRELYLDIRSLPSKGATNAPVILIEYTDYHCPACAHFARVTLPLLDSTYIEPGFVKFVVRDYPIFSLHPGAMEPAVAAHCAGEHGRYWEMHDYLFAQRRAATRDGIVARAQQLGLDSAAIRTCVKKKRHADVVRRGIDEGNRVGIRGTPAFLIAVPVPGSERVRAVRYIYGSASFDEFQRVLNEVLLAIRRAS